VAGNADGGTAIGGIERPDGDAEWRLEVADDPIAVREARRFVERAALEHAGHDLAVDAALVAAELTANALHHAEGPITVVVRGGEGWLVVAVEDGNPRPPVRPAASTSNMTGRGLALVEAVSTRWGVKRTTAGKRVWAELRAEGRGANLEPLAQLDALVGAYDDGSAGPQTPDAHTVVLGDVPTQLLIEAKAHIDNLVREFTLAGTARPGGHEVPEHLAQLIDTVVHGFADARDAIKRQALAAASRGEARTNLVLHLPLSAADAGEAYLAALDEADAYSRAARLLTLETPPVHRLFRQWYVEAVIRQLRDVARGYQPAPVAPFEQILLDEVQRLSAQARVADRTARLQRVTAALARARTPEDVAAVVVSEGVNALGAFGGGLLVPAADREHVSVPGVVGYAADVVDALREERLDAPLPAATVLRTGEPVWLESKEERDSKFPALHGFEAETVSMCAVPLTVGGETIGALRFSFNVRRLFDEDERSFVLALAAQTAQTLKRSEMYAAEREASISLQRALLPQMTPEIPGWDISTYYRPAGDQEAGGDFYDVLPLPDGRFIAVIGDVMGRGVDAAAAMAQTRTMIRAYAVDDPDPAAVFSKVDAYFETMDFSQLVTVLYLLIDEVTGCIQAGNAGHLPPLLVDDTGVAAVDLEIGTPFGVGRFRRSTSALAVPSGTSLIALTDGLVERRGEDIDVGIKRVTEQIAARATRDATALVAAITADQSGAEQDDDLTVIVLTHEDAAR
jgi:serine phosphatase RsbU (regulator of sigma subunit)/anti-sigma regulatory factor (Ser/Thr protein kinase)